LKWIEAVGEYSLREWIAGLKLVGNVIEWFDFSLGSESEVRPVELKDVSSAIGTVHYHPYEHSKVPIPSISDGVNWVYHSFWEISDDLNPIFFIVFKDKYASWAMFPKPPVVRKLWREEYSRVRNEREASVNLCLKLLDKGLIKAGIFMLGRKTRNF